MATKFGTKLAITRLVYKISVRFLCLCAMEVFGDGPANAANRILHRLTLVAIRTKFGTKWAITRHMYKISTRFLHLTRVLRVEQINNFNKSTMVDFRCIGNEICRIFAKNWLELG